MDVVTAREMKRGMKPPTLLAGTQTIHEGSHKCIRVLGLH